MAIKMNTEKMENYRGLGGKSDFEKKEETKHITAGPKFCKLVSYNELGKHVQTFNGKAKPPASIIKLVFEFTASPYTGNYPLTVSFSDYFGDKKTFINNVSVSDKLANGDMSLEYANKTNYMKCLNAMNIAYNTNYNSIAEFVDKVFLVDVTNNISGKTDKTYANFKLETIKGPVYEDPMTGEQKEGTLPDTIGTYANLFDWDTPDPEQYKLLKPWDRAAIKDAVNFKGSPVWDMINSNPDLDNFDVKEAKSTGDDDGKNTENNTEKLKASTKGTAPIKPTIDDSAAFPPQQQSVDTDPAPSVFTKVIPNDEGKAIIMAR